jgi:hypothetical protein
MLASLATPSTAPVEHHASTGTRNGSNSLVYGSLGPSTSMKSPMEWMACFASNRDEVTHGMDGVLREQPDVFL